MTRSGRHSTRAACLSARPEVHRASIPTPPRAAGSISRTKRFPRRRRRGRGDHPPSPRRWTSPRDEPARAKARDRAPAVPRAAPCAAAHGSWVAQCPAPFLSYTKFHVRLGVVRVGKADVQLALFWAPGAFVSHIVGTRWRILRLFIIFATAHTGIVPGRRAILLNQESLN